MVVTLKNKKIELSVNSFGAEMNSLKDAVTGKDYLWTGNPDVWKFHAPVLFPHCGKTKDGYVIIDGHKYPLKSNGFARDLDFKLVEQTDSLVKFELLESAYTMERFPFKFRLTVKYELKENGVKFTSKIKNTDIQTFLFSAGSHSAFCCPRNESETIEDYQIEFEKKEPLTQVLCEENGLLSAALDGAFPATSLYGEKDAGIIPLKPDYFGNGHLFTKITSEWVGLRNKKDGSIIKVNTKGYPYVMLWQNGGNPAFVCIEPWYGMPDPEVTDHQWSKKPGLVQLLPGESFVTDQSISIE